MNPTDRRLHIVLLAALFFCVVSLLFTFANGRAVLAQTMINPTNDGLSHTPSSGSSQTPSGGGASNPATPLTLPKDAGSSVPDAKHTIQGSQLNLPQCKPSPGGTSARCPAPPLNAAAGNNALCKPASAITVYDRSLPYGAKCSLDGKVMTNIYHRDCSGTDTASKIKIAASCEAVCDCKGTSVKDPKGKDTPLDKSNADKLKDALKPQGQYKDLLDKSAVGKNTPETDKKNQDLVNPSSRSGSDASNPKYFGKLDQAKGTSGDSSNRNAPPASFIGQNDPWGGTYNDPKTFNGSSAMQQLNKYSGQQTPNSYGFGATESGYSPNNYSPTYSADLSGLGGVESSAGVEPPMSPGGYRYPDNYVGSYGGGSPDYNFPPSSGNTFPSNSDTPFFAGNQSWGSSPDWGAMVSPSGGASVGPSGLGGGGVGGSGGSLAYDQRSLQNPSQQYRLPGGGSDIQGGYAINTSPLAAAPNDTPVDRITPLDSSGGESGAKPGGFYDKLSRYADNIQEGASIVKQGVQDFAGKYLAPLQDVSSVIKNAPETIAQQGKDYYNELRDYFNGSGGPVVSNDVQTMAQGEQAAVPGGLSRKAAQSDLTDFAGNSDPYNTAYSGGRQFSGTSDPFPPAGSYSDNDKPQTFIAGNDANGQRFPEYYDNNGPVFRDRPRQLFPSDNYQGEPSPRYTPPSNSPRNSAPLPYDTYRASNPTFGPSNPVSDIVHGSYNYGTQPTNGTHPTFGPNPQLSSPIWGPIPNWVMPRNGSSTGNWCYYCFGGRI